MASPVSLCLYITCDGAKLKLPRVTASKRVAQLAKAFVKSVSGKPAYAGLEPQHVTFEINGTVIGEADVVGDVCRDGDVLTAKISPTAQTSVPPAKAAVSREPERHAAATPQTPPPREESAARAPPPERRAAATPQTPPPQEEWYGAEDALAQRARSQIFRTNAKIKIGGGSRADDARFFSQWGEDKFLSRYFLNVPAADGSFLELGACDGVSFSNTKYFEDVLGYGRGVLVEPVPAMFSRIATHRPRCAAVCAAMTSPARAGGALEFVGDCETAGAVATMGEAHAARWHAGATPFKVPARTLRDVLVDDAATRRDYLDFFSLDVEGHEVDVLEGFPWDVVPVGVLLVETLDAHPGANDACRALLRERTRLKFAGVCGKSSAGCSEVWCDPAYFRRRKLFALPAGAPPARDGWAKARP